MNSYEKFYRERMYPFQDGILSIVTKLKTPFYLTGGTALSRYYFNHRYSDDLDLFVNNDEKYNHYIDLLFQALIQGEKSGHYTIDYNRQRRSENYIQIVLRKEFEDEQINLRIDVVNDISVHYGDFEPDPVIGRIDSWRNILSNKISAVFRYEPKDFIDIWIISKNKQFNWQDIIEEAKTKEMGVDPVAIFEIIKSLPSDVLSVIKWCSPVDEADLLNNLSVIADDILQGNDNSL